ncbi:cytochrome c oxidase, subunit VIa [Pholiota molesta]|nr:cytochrome c oxidase, subunit VIa [Pholiota molesta]
MSFAVRNSLRTVARSVRSRKFTTAIEGIPQGKAFEEYVAADKALQHHAAEASDLWRKISFYVAIPSIIVCTAWVYNAEAEHKAHIEHIKEENGGHLPEPPAYDYMNRRSKPYPWGPNTLFFNPEVNKDMSGAI